MEIIDRDMRGDFVDMLQIMYRYAARAGTRLSKTSKCSASAAMLKTTFWGSEHGSRPRRRLTA